MSIAEYIANLNRIKDQALANWSNLSSIEKQVFEDSFDWLVDNLDIKRGSVTVNDDLTGKMNEFLNVVVDLVNKSKGYETKLTGFLGDLDTISKNNEKFHGSYNNFDINTAGVKNVQKTVVEEIINQYTDNGLNPNFAAPLRDGIFRNILAGANMKDIRQYLNIYILGGEDQSGKLHQYLNQTAQQAVDSYTGMINQQLNKDFKFTGYIISGSLIETSSSQCIYAVEHSHDPGGYLTFEEWNTVLDIARNNKKALLIEGTTLVNLPINKLHWGCRHDFTPVIVKPKEEPKKATVKKPKAEPKPQPTAQQAQTKSVFQEATSREQAKQITKDMFVNSGFTVGNVSASSDLDTTRMNRINAKLNQLLNEYQVSKNQIKGPKPIDIKFKSTDEHFGAVAFIGDPRFPTRRGEILTINFGDKFEASRGVPTTDPKLAFFRGKAQVDKENVDISTVVHEFGHVISTDHQNRIPDPDVDNISFWNDIKKIQREYENVLQQLSATRLTDPESTNKYNEIFLGQYASSNIREFMAEAFTEYKLKTNPSFYAKKVGLLIDKYFGK
jgi:hypothetical protein